jgi:hypothetical protein
MWSAGLDGAVGMVKSIREETVTMEGGESFSTSLIDWTQARKHSGICKGVQSLGGMNKVKPSGSIGGDPLFRNSRNLDRRHASADKYPSFQIFLSLDRRRRRSFYENIPMSSSISEKPDFGEADLTESPSECSVLTGKFARGVVDDISFRVSPKNQVQWRCHFEAGRKIHDPWSTFTEIGRCIVKTSILARKAWSWQTILTVAIRQSIFILVLSLTRNLRYYYGRSCDCFSSGKFIQSRGTNSIS